MINQVAIEEAGYNDRLSKQNILLKNFCYWLIGEIKIHFQQAQCNLGEMVGDLPTKSFGKPENDTEYFPFS